MLLCTIAPEAMDRIASDFQKKFHRPLFVIGEITANEAFQLVNGAGRAVDVRASGWDHFKRIE